MSKQQVETFSCEFPKELIAEIERRKGFYSRNKYIQRAVLKAIVDEDKHTSEDLQLLQSIKWKNNKNNSRQGAFLDSRPREHPGDDATTIESGIGTGDDSS